VELRQLRYFVAVAEDGGVNRAARRLFVAQPSLSQQIRSLERSVGVVLFERTPVGMALTDAGVTLYDRAIDLLASADAAVDAARQAAGAPSVLRIGWSVPFGAELVEPIVSSFVVAEPQVETRLVHLDLVNFERAVATRRVDVALVALPVSDERVDADPLFSEPRVLIASAAHRLARDEATDLEAILDEPFVINDRMPGRWSEFWTAVPERNGPARIVRFDETTPGEAISHIVNGEGIETGPLSLTRFMPTPMIRYVPVIGLTEAVVGVTFHRGDERPAVRSFRSLARHVTRSLIGLVPHAQVTP
jgi:DNA-binding transcriptional LysR family regulator